MLTANRLHAHLDPWKLWHQLHGELNDFWGQPMSAPAASLNLWAKEDAAILSVELPGRRAEDVHVSVHRDVVTIEADARTSELQQGAAAVREERTHGTILRQLRLPFEVDAQRVEAVYDQGVLTVNLHRHASTLPSKITVKAG